MQTTTSSTLANVRSIAEILPEVLERYHLEYTSEETQPSNVAALVSTVSTQPELCRAS